MSVKRFTQDNVGAIKVPAGKADHWEPDAGLPGFFIRFRNGGEGTYFIRFTVNGQKRKMPLGRVSQIKLADAQAKARQHFGTVASKVDPVVEQAKAVTTSAVLMPSLFDDFKLHLETKRRSASHISRSMDYLKRYFAGLHGIPLDQINRATVARELNKITAGNGRIAMTRARAALSKFFSWCFTQGHEFMNPVQGTERHESNERDRVLSPEELRVIWEKSGDSDFGQIVKLLMLTGARRSQIGDLKVAEMLLEPSGLDTRDRVLELPGQGSAKARKGGSKHDGKFIIPLSAQALAILKRKAANPNGGEYVFGNGKGKGGYAGWVKMKKQLDRRIGAAIGEPWGFHDFRRSFETLGQDVCKIDDSWTDACLNHKPQAKKGVRGRYNYATKIDEKRKAMEIWGAYIESLVTKKQQLQIAA